MDLDALREALGRHDKPIWWNATSQTEVDVLRTIEDAARAVLDSEELQWCEPHRQTAIPSDADMDEFEVVECAGAMLGWWGDCSMVRRRLLAEEGT